MKVINSNNNNKIECFYNSGGKYTGFNGNVEVFDESIYVDTRDGTGYTEVFKKLNRMINYFANKYKIYGASIEDNIQNIAVYILEGILKFNPHKGYKLSTFIQMYVNQRLINKIRDNGRIYKNPTVLKTSLFRVNCKCGADFTIVIGSNESIESKNCGHCGEEILGSKFYAINIGPSYLSENIKDTFDEDSGKITLNDILSENSFYIPIVYGEKTNLEDAVSYNHDLNKVLENQSTEVKKLVDLVCAKGYSISEAARMIGLSYMKASNRLKKLRKDGLLNEILNR